MSMPPCCWPTDELLFAELAGGQTLIDWFGFCPNFHDGKLEKFELFDGNAVLSILTHRLTRDVDADGYFVLDRLATVTLRFFGVTGVKLEGLAGSIISYLCIRRLQTDEADFTWHSCAAPIAGNIEVAFDAVT